MAGTGNTGRKKATWLEKYYVATGLPVLNNNGQPIRKKNVQGDPDYVPPVYDYCDCPDGLNHCVTTTTTTVALTTTTTTTQNVSNTTTTQGSSSTSNTTTQNTTQNTSTSSTSSTTQAQNCSQIAFINSNAFDVMVSYGCNGIQSILVPANNCVVVLAENGNWSLPSGVISAPANNCGNTTNTSSTSSTSSTTTTTTAPACIEITFTNPTISDINVSYICNGSQSIVVPANSCRVVLSENGNWALNGCTSSLGNNCQGSTTNNTTGTTSSSTTTTTTQASNCIAVTFENSNGFAVNVPYNCNGSQNVNIPANDCIAVLSENGSWALPNGVISTLGDTCANTTGTTTNNTTQPPNCNNLSCTTSINCLNTTTAEITVNITGGTSPYQYSVNGGAFNNVSGNQQIITVGNGASTITIRDINNCLHTTPQLNIDCTSNTTQNTTQAPNCNNYKMLIGGNVQYQDCNNVSQSLSYSGSGSNCNFSALSIISGTLNTDYVNNNGVCDTTTTTTVNGCTDLAPSNLQANTNSNNLVSLRWTDNSANETGFRVEYSTDNSNWSLYSIENSNTTFSNNSNQGVNLNNNTEYWFRVQNLGSCNSDWSNVDNVLTAPQLPQNFTTNNTASIYQMNLNWDNNNPNLGTFPVTYKIEVSKLSSICDGGLKLIANTNSNNYLITNLIGGNSNAPQAYTYRITAINVNGVESNFVQNANVVGAIAVGSSTPNSCLNNDINLFASDPCGDCAFWN